MQAQETSSSQIDLTWTAPDATVTGYKLQRKSGGGEFGDVGAALLPASPTSYSDTGLAAGTQYTYRVAAVNGETTSGWSNEASATTQDAPPPPPPSPAPTALQAQAVSSSQIDLTWTAPATAGTEYVLSEYKMERKTGAAEFAPLDAVIATNSLEWTDRGLAASTTYVYRLKAVYTGGAIGYSNETTGTTQAAPPPPPTPSVPVLTATAKSSTEIELTWMASTEAGGTGVANYEIQRSPNGTDGWTTVHTQAASAELKWTHTGLTPSTTYYYRIRALDGADPVNPSAWSQTASAKTFADTTAPTVTVNSPTQQGYSNVNSPVLKATATDAESPIMSASYHIDGGQTWFPMTAINGTAFGQKTVDLTATIAALGEGPHTVEVKAKNDANIEGTSDLINFTVDTKAPFVYEANPQPPQAQNLGLNDASVTFSAWAIDRDPTSGIVRAEYSLDGGAPTQLNPAPTWDWGGKQVALEGTIDLAEKKTDGSYVVGDGKHSVIMRAYDRAGNVSAPGAQATATFTVDRTAPKVVVALIWPTTSIYTNDTPLNLYVLTKDNVGVDRIRYHIDSGNWVEIPLTEGHGIGWRMIGVEIAVSVKTLSEDEHTISFEAADVANNWGSDQL